MCNIKWEQWFVYYKNSVKSLNDKKELPLYLRFVDWDDLSDEAPLGKKSADDSNI